MQQQDSRDPSTTVSAPTAEATTTRRGFLGFMTVVLGAVPVVGGLFAALRSGLAPAFSNRPERIPLCKLGDVPETGVKEVAVSYQMRQGPIVVSVAKVVFVTRDPETREILALSGECTHLSCPVQKKELVVDGDKKAPLTCPCHGGKFSQTGKVLAGPPQRDLDRLPLQQPLPTRNDETIYLLEI